jgi:hypothetical protein
MLPFLHKSLHNSPAKTVMPPVLVRVLAVGENFRFKKTVCEGGSFSGDDFSKQGSPRSESITASVLTDLGWVLARMERAKPR